MSGRVKVDQVQLGNHATPANNAVLQTNQDGTFKLARGSVGATTQDILTVDAAGKVAFPQGKAQWSSGEVIQVRTFTDVGASITTNVYTNLVTSIKPITPKSTNSTIIVSFSGQYGCANLNSYNSQARFWLYRDTTANLIGTMYEVSAVTGAGGNGAMCAGNITALYQNTTLTDKAFGIGGYNVVNTLGSWANNLVITLTEVQN